MLLLMSFTVALYRAPGTGTRCPIPSSATGLNTSSSVSITKSDIYKSFEIPDLPNDDKFGMCGCLGASYARGR